MYDKMLRVLDKRISRMSFEEFVFSSVLIMILVTLTILVLS